MKSIQVRRHVVVLFPLLAAFLTSLLVSTAAQALTITGTFPGLGKNQELLIEGLPLTDSQFFKNECKMIRGDGNADDCVAPVAVKFNNALPPRSDARLRVVAAGDIGHTQAERDAQGFAATDFVFVYGVFEAGKDPQRLLTTPKLFETTVSTCPGLPDNPQNEHKGIGTDGKACGPNFHSVTDTDMRFETAYFTKPNGTDFFTDMIPDPAKRGDAVTIGKEDLEKLLREGMIELILWPNNSSGTAVAHIKYKSATLTYEVPEPSSLLTVATTLTGLGLLAWRRRR